jgi:hypothetical protein
MKTEHYEIISELDYEKQIAAATGTPIGKARNGAWRVRHRATRLLCTSVGILATVTKAQAAYWMQRFEETAPETDRVQVGHAVTNAGLHKEFGNWMVWKHAGGGKKLDTWPS